MKKSDAVKKILHAQGLGEREPQVSVASAYAPSNIALCKYWGKRDQELNLPVTSSLSVSLDTKGAAVEMKLNTENQDRIFLNNQLVAMDSSFSKRLLIFLDLFRSEKKWTVDIHIQSTVPVAAGLASSACGFASIVQALNILLDWNLPRESLSILARLGSGSASRSLWHGFVEWHVGTYPDGSDSHGELLTTRWPEFCIGLLIFSEHEKALSSREAMQRTVVASPLYSAWPAKVARDLPVLREAIHTKDIVLLGETAESNALTMHATMLSAWPPVTYALPETLIHMRKIWRLRDEGMSLFFTQDAGPNLKLIFLQKDSDAVREHFPAVQIVQPFSPAVIPRSF